MSAHSGLDIFPPCLSGTACSVEQTCRRLNPAGDLAAGCFQLHPESADLWVAVFKMVLDELFDPMCTQPLDVVLRHAIGFANADTATITVPIDADALEVRAATGLGAGRLIGLTLSSRDSITGKVIATATPAIEASIGSLLASDLAGLGLGPAAIVPLPVGLHGQGALGVARLATKDPFGAPDLTMLASFANLAGYALHLDTASEQRQTREVIAERDRIANAIRDNTIRHLSEVALGLDALIGASDNLRQRIRLQKSSAQVDSLIRVIRESIYDIPPFVPKARTTHADPLADPAQQNHRAPEPTDS